jgi:hypothetical protein
MNTVDYVQHRADTLLAHATDIGHASLLISNLLSELDLSRLSPEEFVELDDVVQGIQAYIHQQWGE